jgi:hypothetical protein
MHRRLPTNSLGEGTYSLAVTPGVATTAGTAAFRVDPSHVDPDPGKVRRTARSSRLDDSISAFGVRQNGRILIEKAEPTSSENA